MLLAASSPLGESLVCDHIVHGTVGCSRTLKVRPTAGADYVESTAFGDARGAETFALMHNEDVQMRRRCVSRASDHAGGSRPRSPPP
jgi:hypothetical protein